MDFKTNSPTILAVIPGGTAVLDLTRDRRYNTLAVTATATDATKTFDDLVAEINFKINGKTVRQLSPKDIRAFQALNGRSSYNGTNNQLIIHLREPWYTLPADQYGSGWGMGGVAEFRIEFLLKGSAASPIPGLALAAYTISDRGADSAGKLLPIGQIKQYSSEFLPVPSVGEVVFRNLNWKGFLKRLHLRNHSNNGSITFSDLKLKVGTEIIFESKVADLAPLLLAYGLIAQPGYVCLPFDLLNHGGLGLPSTALRDSELILTTTAAGDTDGITLIQEFVAAPGAV